MFKIGSKIFSLQWHFNPVILQAQHFVSVEMPLNRRQRRDFWGEGCLQILYIFVLLEGEKTFQGKVVKNFARNTNMHKIWKLRNFTNQNLVYSWNNLLSRYTVII